MCPPLHLVVEAIEKGALVSPATKVNLWAVKIMLKYHYWW